MKTVILNKNMDFGSFFSSIVKVDDGVMVSEVLGSEAIKDGLQLKCPECGGIHGAGIEKPLRRVFYALSPEERANGLAKRLSVYCGECRRIFKEKVEARNAAFGRRERNQEILAAFSDAAEAVVAGRDTMPDHRATLGQYSCPEEARKIAFDLLSDVKGGDRHLLNMIVQGRCRLNADGEWVLRFGNKEVPFEWRKGGSSKN
jgi:hypothetical protein